MCSLNMFQVSLGGLFVFKYLCLFGQPFHEKLEMEKMTIFTSGFQLGHLLQLSNEAALSTSSSKMYFFPSDELLEQ